MLEDLAVNWNSRGAAIWSTVILPVLEALLASLAF